MTDSIDFPETVAAVLPKVSPAERDRLLQRCVEEGLDPDEAVLVDRGEFLVIREQHAEIAEAFSKYLRRHCRYEADEIAAMDLGELARAVKPDVEESE
jgi:hypothetical protein